MSIKRYLALGSVLALLAFGAAPAGANEKAKSEGNAKTKCDMTFSITEWAAAFKHAAGSGTITCDNGETANVVISAKGAGLSAGKFKIDGHGEISPVTDIHQIFGSYLAAEGNAGVESKAGETKVMTKGKVSLALAGTGEGWNVGLSLAKFTITPAK